MLKPQDIVVLLHLTTWQGRVWSFEKLSQDLGISTSEIHNGLKRATVARLYFPTSRMPRPHALTEFCVHGLKYVFPAALGGPTRGIGTCAASGFAFPFTVEDGETPVWPHPDGLVRGPAVEPLYHSIPGIVAKQPELYYLLVLVDFIRIGRGRERAWATDTLTRLLEHGGIHGTQS